MLTIHLVRHGQTDWNAGGRLQGWADVPLNATGLAQAQATAAKLRGAPIGAVICSDLERARQTAAPIAAGAGLLAQIEPALRERSFGQAEGLTDAEVDELAGGQLQQLWLDPDFTFPGGETRRQTYDRVGGYLAKLLTRPPATELALVSHSGALRMANGFLHGVPVESLPPFPIGNGEIVTLTIDPTDWVSEQGGRL